MDQTNRDRTSRTDQNLREACLQESSAGSRSDGAARIGPASGAEAGEHDGSCLDFQRDQNPDSMDWNAALISLEERLQQRRDDQYRSFFCRISPAVDPERVLGIPVSVLEPMVRQLSGQEREALLKAESRPYYEEDLMAVKLINQSLTMDIGWAGVQRLLPCLNTWSLTDGLSLPKVDSPSLLEKAGELLEMPQSGARRLGILWIMKRAIHPHLDPEWIQRALALRDSSRDVQMAQAWLMCEGMIDDPDWFWPVLQNHPVFEVQRMAIQKCLDSRRISADQKERLRQFRKELNRRIKSGSAEDEAVAADVINRHSR